MISTGGSPLGPAGTDDPGSWATKGFGVGCGSGAAVDLSCDLNRITHALRVPCMHLRQENGDDGAKETHRVQGAPPYVVSMQYLCL